MRRIPLYTVKQMTTTLKNTRNMKKTIFSIIALVIVSVSSFAQEPALPKGSNVIDAGVGFSTGLSNIALPPIEVSYEHIFVTFGTNDQWGVGAGAFGGVFSQKFSGNNMLGGCVCAQGNMHFSPLSKLDIYAGLNVGYVMASTSGVSAGAMTVGGQVGARYFFTDSVGAFLQIGEVGTINLGVSFRL